MSTYIAAYKGYIADVPRVWFKRCDGRIFYFDEITQANASPNVQYTEINAGWSLFPVAYLPGQSTMEISMTSGQFNAELFALANGSNFNEDDTYTTFTTEHLIPDATAHTITLKNTPLENTVSIAGMKQGSAAAEESPATEGQEATDATFAVSGKTITLPESIEGEVEVSYEYTVAGAKVAMIDNATSAIGEAVFKWPVYNSGEDCTDASIKGYVIMRVFRCRVTQMPGFDTSYKSAASNSVTWATMDAKRDDGKAYSIAYVDA
jgi:hypothetical protein